MSDRLLRSPNSKLDASSAVNRARSTGSNVASARPASIREKSEQRIDKPQEPQAVSVRNLEPRALNFSHLCGFVIESVLNRTEHQCQGSTVFMTHIGEKRRFCSVHFGQCFCTSTLFLIGLRVGDGS